MNRNTPSIESVMESINAKLRGRILLLIVSWLLLGCLIGFGFGWFVGYRNGRGDTLEEIEQKLNQPKQERTTTAQPCPLAVRYIYSFPFQV